jgi:Bcr/CflA subfamily drug resistance transporter
MRKGLTAFLALLLVTLGQFAIDIYLPSLPAMVVDLGATKSAVQQTLSFFLIGFAFSQLIYGPLSERFGRRIVLLIGLLIFIGGALGAYFAHTVDFLIIMRLIQGLGIGAANVLCRAILRDLYHGSELAKKVTFLGILWVLSPVVAPVLGGYIEEYWGWRMNFAFLAIFVLLIWIWAFLLLPETKDQTQRQSVHPIAIGRNYLHLLSNRPFLGYVFADFFLYGVLSSFYVAGPFLLQKVLGLSPVAFGWTMLIISGGYLLGSSFNVRLIHRLPQTTVIKIGLAWVLIVSVGMVLLAGCGILNIASIVLPLCLLFFGIAFIFTNCIGLSLSIFPHLAGSASAVWGFLAYFGGTLATSSMSYLPEKTSLPLSIALLIQCLLTFFVLWWGMSQKNRAS